MEADRKKKEEAVKKRQQLMGVGFNTGTRRIILIKKDIINLLEIFKQPEVVISFCQRKRRIKATNSGI